MCIRDSVRALPVPMLRQVPWFDHPDSALIRTSLTLSNLAYSYQCDAIFGAVQFLVQCNSWLSAQAKLSLNLVFLISLLPMADDTQPDDTQPDWKERFHDDIIYDPPVSPITVSSTLPAKPPFRKRRIWTATLKAMKANKK